MAKKRKTSPDELANDPAPAATVAESGRPGEVRPILLLFLLPLLSQLLQRGALPVRLVDLAYFVPTIAVYAAVWKFLYPNRALYGMLVFFLLLADYGATFFAAIGFYGAAFGMLFVTLPLLSVPYVYRYRGPERLAAVKDYFQVGLRVTGVAAALFIAAVVPHLLGERTLNHYPGLALVSTGAENADGTAVAVRTFAFPAGATLAAITAHYDAWVRRPFYTPFETRPVGGGFLVAFRSALPYFRKTYTLLVEREADRFTLREAIAAGDLPGFLLAAKAGPAAPEAPATLGRFAGPAGDYSGTFDERGLRLVPKEMAEDSGFSGELLFVVPGIEGASVRVYSQPPGDGVKLEHLLVLAEDLILRKQYPDFKPLVKERVEIAGAQAAFISGDAKRDGKDFRLVETTLIHRGRILILHGETPVERAADFEPVYRGFLSGLRLAADPAPKAE